MQNSEIRTLGPQDGEVFKQLLRVFERVFEMQDFRVPDDAHLADVLQRNDFIVLCACDGDRVIGGLTAYVLHQYYSTRPLVYIFDLAVLPEYQRRGIGRALITAIRTLSTARGYEEVFVQADVADTYALDFYRSTKPTEEEEVRHFYYTLNAKR